MSRLWDHLVVLLFLTTNLAANKYQAVRFVDELESSSDKIINDNYFFPTHQYSKRDFSNDAEAHPRQENEHLSNKSAKEVCQLDRGVSRSNRLVNNTYLKHCHRYKLDTLLSTEAIMSIMHNSTDECRKVLDALIQVDELVNDYWTSFVSLLSRYNCHNGYSVKWSCKDCKTAYRDWLCATSLAYYMKGEHVKPCLSFCERVEQRCPYLNPISKEQYGGQPVFICRDPNIPFVQEITPDIPYENPPRCYDLCHISDYVDELENDSLSRYRFGQCAKEDTVAEQVRNQAHH